jgi:hypothetical protein
MAGQAVAVELQPVMSGLTNRLYLTDARDGSVRLFVVSRPASSRFSPPGGHPDGVPRHQEPIASAGCCASSPSASDSTPRPRLCLRLLACLPLMSG